MRPRKKFPKEETLGINNWITSKTAVTPRRWKLVTSCMKLVVKAGPYYKYPVLGGLLKKFMMFTPVLLLPWTGLRIQFCGNR